VVDGERFFRVFTSGSQTTQTAAEAAARSSDARIRTRGLARFMYRRYASKSP